MKQNVKSVKIAKAQNGANNHYYMNEEDIITNLNKDDKFGLKTTKMKRNTKDPKLGDKYLKHLTLKSIRISFANLFKPSKRIGRNQQFNEEKCVDFNRMAQTPNPSNLVTTRVNFAASARVVKFNQPQFQALDTCFDESRNLKSQFNELTKAPTRSMTVTNIHASYPGLIQTSVTKTKQERKMQPSMGVKVISVKSAKVKEIKHSEPRELVPFLDSIENLVPISSSTFIAPKQARASIETIESKSLSSQISSASISPVSFKSSRKQCIQVRSISVMNVSSIMSNQF